MRSSCWTHAGDSSAIGASSVIDLFKARVGVKFHAPRRVLSNGWELQFGCAVGCLSFRASTISGILGTPGPLQIVGCSACNPNQPGVLRRSKAHGLAQNALTIARASRLQILCP